MAQVVLIKRKMTILGRHQTRASLEARGECAASHGLCCPRLMFCGGDPNSKLFDCKRGTSLRRSRFAGCGLEEVIRSLQLLNALTQRQKSVLHLLRCITRRDVLLTIPVKCFDVNHYCPAISGTDSVGYRHRPISPGSRRRAGGPVKWAFSQKGSRSKSVEFGRG
jgi:hypothetical protein